MKTIKITLSLIVTLTLMSSSLPENNKEEMHFETSITVEEFYNYAVVCIKNPLDFPINYSIKWGNGPWEKLICLGNGQSYRHWHCYSYGSQSSPKLQIRFDYTVNDGIIKYQYYELDKYARYDTYCEGACQYQFQYTPGTRYRRIPCIDLFRIN